MKIIQTEKDGWFVWTKTGSMPKKRHATRDKAEAEAARLAAKHPGKKFIVLQMVSKFGADA